MINDNKNENMEEDEFIVHRFYKNIYPKENELVVVKVTKVEENVSYV